jgi:PAS domain-containing protein
MTASRTLPTAPAEPGVPGPPWILDVMAELLLLNVPKALPWLCQALQERGRARMAAFVPASPTEPVILSGDGSLDPRRMLQEPPDETPGAVRLPLGARGCIILAEAGTPLEAKALAPLARILDLLEDSARGREEVERLVEVRHQELAMDAARLRTIYESVHDAIFLQALDKDTFLDVNHRLTEMTSHPREFLLGTSLGGIGLGLWPYTPETAREKAAAAAQGTPQTFEWPGTAIWSGWK